MESWTQRWNSLQSSHGTCDVLIIVSNLSSKRHADSVGLPNFGHQEKPQLAGLLGIQKNVDKSFELKKPTESATRLRYSATHAKFGHEGGAFTH